MSDAGLYVHVPFCLTRCGYCDFNTYAGLDHLAGGYVEALRREAGMWAPEWRGTEFVSLFLGGGTPTTLPVPRLVTLLDEFRTRFTFASGAEVTTEANPDTVDEAYLSELLAGGVTRLSMGVQSFDPTVLVALERIHSPESALKAVAAAREAGVSSLNLDLIYGVHGETLESWRATLQRAIEVGPEHLSCYALTIEPSTPLGRKVGAGLVPPPDPDVQATMYDLACEVLAGTGYEHYEVSNWAKPGYRCVHNMGYWEGRPYLGLGAGAHSCRDGTRWWNVRPPQQYMSTVAAGRKPVGGEERLTDQERDLERLLLGLRMADGVTAEHADPVRVEALVAEGLARRAGSRLALTDRGLFVANEIVLELAAPAPS
jgi:putative oxygen-independent coproporphyrinogen III oxidase